MGLCTLTKTQTWGQFLGYITICITLVWCRHNLGITQETDPILAIYACSFTERPFRHHHIKNPMWFEISKLDFRES